MTYEAADTMTLQELTGCESGAVTWDDGTVWIGNWTHLEGLPRMLSPIGTIGLGEVLLTTTGRVATPSGTKRAMMQHAREQDPTMIPRTGYSSRRVRAESGDSVIVTTCGSWN